MYYSIMSLSDLSIRIWELVIFVVIILGVGNLFGIYLGIAVGIVWIAFIYIVHRLTKNKPMKR